MNKEMFQAQSRGGRPKKKRSRRYPHYITEPITSYGLILYCMREGEPIFLLYQRRDNFEYMDFLKGLWGAEGQLPALFSLMSHEERQRIREYTFDELWDDLWVGKNCRIYRDGYHRAKKKYDSMHHLIPNLLDNTVSHIEEPPWGFPKGKKNSYREDPIRCALREFQEETHLQTSEVRIVRRIPFTENFKGSNGRAYATHYYLAVISNPAVPNKYQTPKCIREETVSEEASNVGWFSYPEACQHLNARRQTIMGSVMESVQQFS